MRGIAAIAVMVYHCGLEAHWHISPYAYLAVDFFFMLSGFVLTRSYEAKLRTSLSARRFMEMRIVRLYPLFALGVLVGAARVAGQFLFHSPHAQNPWDAALAFITNILMLPAPGPAELYPLNGPGWSLFLELIFNFFLAIALARMRSLFILLLCAVAGLVLFCFILVTGHSDFGPVWQNFILGIFRAGFSFSVGILLARVHVAEDRRRSLLSVLAIFALGVVLIARPTGREWLYDAVCIFLVLPLILWLGTVTELPPPLAKMGAILGDVSYPLYAIQIPLLKMFGSIFIMRLYWPVGAALTVFGVLAFGVAWFLAVFFDAPVRKWLSARLRVRLTAPLQE
jgi:peptidoglycan/LPS O-acetylase OafA/YrhL